MELLRIEILNPKALQLINGMQDLQLIRVYNKPNSRLSAYLKEMRRQAEDAPDEVEIGEIVEEVRRENHDSEQSC